ncbi:MAG: tetratricopeptide repeat protein [Spirochaetaceae bacterium]|nr:tetratricopeptide repeat protein [Spirochaetaceae bacterium]
MKKGLYPFVLVAFVFLLFSCSSQQGIGIVGEKDRIYSNILSEYYLIGDAYLDNKNYQKAIEYYTKALDHPDLTESAQYKIAFTYALSENWEKARLGYEQLLEKDPDNSDLEKSLAYIYARQGDLAYASASYRKLVEKNPYDQALQENFITVLITGNYLEEAEIALHQLKTDFPDNSSIDDFENKLTKAWESQEGKTAVLEDEILEKSQEQDQGDKDQEPIVEENTNE